MARHPDQKDFDFARFRWTMRPRIGCCLKGKTVAVFQLESRGMQGMLRDAKPSVFEDIIALVALYRPGPMDLIPSFCARKHGKEEGDLSASADGSRVVRNLRDHGVPGAGDAGGAAPGRLLAWRC